MKQPLSLPPIHPKLATIAVALAMIAAIITSIPLITHAEESTQTITMKVTQQREKERWEIIQTMSGIPSAYNLAAYLSTKNDHYRLTFLYSENSEVKELNVENYTHLYDADIHRVDNNGEPYTTDYIVEAYQNFYYSSKDSSTSPYINATVNIPVFTTYGEACKYLLNGDTTGQLNAPKIVDLDNFTLTGFECDNTIHATWTGINCPEPVDPNGAYVTVVPIYYRESESGEITQETEESKIVAVDSGTSFSKPYNEYFADITNTEKCKMVLRFDLTYNDINANTIYKGKPVLVTFTKNGNIFSVDKNDSNTNTLPTTDLDRYGTYEPTLEKPDIHVDTTSYSGGGTTTSESMRKFSFNNAAENLNVEIKGRWWTVDDIELYKENLMWNYKYATLVKSDLTDWATLKESVSSIGEFSFKELGAQSFNNLLTKYPVDSRTYFGGTNALGNWLGGYNDAMQTLKMLLNNCESIYNGVEIYARYYYIDSNGTAHYSKWTHYYDNLAKPEGSSGSMWNDKENMFTENESVNGLTPDEIKDLEESGNTRNDPDTIPEYNFQTDSIAEATENFFTMMQSMFSGMGQFPNLVAQIFGFLPQWLKNLLALSLGAIIILRFIGR